MGGKQKNLPKEIHNNSQHALHVPPLNITILLILYNSTIYSQAITYYWLNSCLKFKDWLLLQFIRILKYLVFNEKLKIMILVLTLI